MSLSIAMFWKNSSATILGPNRSERQVFQEKNLVTCWLEECNLVDEGFLNKHSEK